MNEESLQLLEEIRQQASEECDAIRATTQAQKRDEHEHAERQVAALRTRHQAELEKQLGEIHKTSLQEQERLARQAERSFEQRLCDLVQQRVKELLAEHCRTPQYRQTLIQWCRSGIAILGGKAVIIEASFGAASLLDEKTITAITGEGEASVQVHVMGDNAEEGIVMFSEDRRMLYSSLVSDHLQRSRTAIERMVHQHLKGKQEGNS